MPNLNPQLTSPETDRKVALPASFFLMVLLWLLAAAILVAIGFAAYTNENFEWDNRHRMIVAVLGFCILPLIPMQLANYYAQMRAAQEQARTGALPEDPESQTQGD